MDAVTTLSTFVLLVTFGATVAAGLGVVFIVIGNSFYPQESQYKTYLLKFTDEEWEEKKENDPTEYLLLKEALREIKHKRFLARIFVFCALISWGMVFVFAYMSAHY